MSMNVMTSRSAVKKSRAMQASILRIEHDQFVAFEIHIDGCDGVVCHNIELKQSYTTTLNSKQEGQ